MNDPNLANDPESMRRARTIEFAYVHPLQAGKVLGLMYAALALIIVPFMALGPILGGANGVAAMVPLVFVALMYPVMGFVGGVLMAALYNFVAKQVGGFRFDLG